MVSEDKKILSTETISIEEYLEILQFSKDVIKTNLEKYKKRNQFNPVKIFNDIVTGKVAEYAVYNYFKIKNRECSKPDIKIYEAAKKSFDADLLVEEKIKIHIKSQTIEQANKYSLSWTFQAEDSLVKTPTTDDYIVLCRVDDLKVDILSIKSASYFIGKYKDPKLFKLKGIKKVIYYHDVE